MLGLVGLAVWMLILWCLLVQFHRSGFVRIGLSATLAVVVYGVWHSRSPTVDVGDGSMRPESTQSRNHVSQPTPRYQELAASGIGQLPATGNTGPRNLSRKADVPVGSTAPLLLIH
jgi:hypothetical protein